jgi:hypothetical protein
MTVDERQPRAQAIAIARGRRLAVGSDEDVLNLASGATRKVDPFALIDVPIRRTMVGGRWVFKSQVSFRLPSDVVWGNRGSAMANGDQDTGRWWRYGCLGCVGVLVLVLSAVTVLLSLGRSAARSQRIATRSVEESLPAPRIPPEAPPAGEAEAAPAYSDAPPLPHLAFTPEDDAEIRAGRVLIDLAQGEFHVEPAAPGEPLRVEAEYDENRYELVTRLEEDDDRRWSYEVRFRQTGTPGLLSFLAQLMGASNPRVTVSLPREVPMDLDLRFSRGGGRADLGGLWLTEASVAFTQGGGELEFSEPLEEPTEALTIDATMGGGSFRWLGNASPRTLKVVTQMGGGEVDLRGEWLRDCEISLESRMGGLEVRLPDDVITRGLPRGRSAAGDADASRPTLTFSYSRSMGEIEFRD